MNKLRYFFFGKQIQKSLEKAEEAGNLVATNFFQEEIRNLKKTHEEEIEKLVNKRLAELKYSVNPDDIMTASIDKMGRSVLIFLGGEQLSQAEIYNFKQEVIALRSMRIWKIINETIKSQAHDVMFTKSKTYDDMVTGKMMLYNLDVIDRVIKTIETFDMKKG